MITLTGTLRQTGKVTFEEKDRLKLWVEHETPRENGVSDLKIEELFLPYEFHDKMPKNGSTIGVQVRAYVSGRDVKYSAIGLAGNIGGGMAKSA